MVFQREYTECVCFSNYELLGFINNSIALCEMIFTVNSLAFACKGAGAYIYKKSEISSTYYFQMPLITTFIYLFFLMFNCSV